jgi:hypothetical protein
MRRGTLVTLFAAMILLMLAGTAIAGPLPGAIFTTLEDGSRVNANIYQYKEDVYLDGGPGVQAPSKAAALPEGWYYFQVTDPSGKVLLSTDPVECRQFYVSADGVITEVYTGATMEIFSKVRGKMVSSVIDCTHKTGIDQDHADKGAITVQLFPYNDTPNKGGVYKVWVTPVDKFAGDPKLVDNGYSPGNYHGFIPSWSKTDNFKVRMKKPPPPDTTVIVKKFHDLNANGVWDEGEPELAWQVEITDPLGTTNIDTTPFQKIVAPGGMWYFEELFPDVDVECDPGWMQTALIVDGVPQPVSPKIGLNLQESTGETITIVFGNVKLGCVEAVKFYDKNANAEWDEGESPIEGFRIRLTGTNVKGELVDIVAQTRANGSVRFCGLLPGDYKIEELMPNGDWIATTPESHEFSLAPGDCKYFEFGNVCVLYVDFNTKGFWHNKNGLALIQPEWIDYVNGLDPYKANPFDGLDAEGNPVPAAKGPAGEDIAAAGTALAEISAYLVDSNAGGDPKIQLGQQLLAFTFNVKYTGAGAIWGPDGITSADAMIADATAAWNAGGAAANQWAGVLDGYNNMNGEDGAPLVTIVRAEPCAVVY